MRKLPENPSIEIAPSILAADFSRLGEIIGGLEGYVRLLHLDIMDGHFVPNITIGPPVVAMLRPHSTLFFDTHLMISDPMKYAPEFVKAGSNGITFHLEVVDDPHAMIKLLRNLGVNVGISIKPATPVEALEPVINDIDMVLLMTVEPGFGGQEFIPESMDRCRTLRTMLRDDQRLEVDGGIYADNIADIVAAGADTIVVGTAVFRQPCPPSQAVADLKDAARQCRPPR
ncbi:MAG: ribulose-phosphate 3-epimerase [Sedimentisphaerales bacterium]|nr:ribulose-phosphate 3-epimerase [Sedimentisphaerales bacterium]